MTDYRLPITDDRLPMTDYRFQRFTGVRESGSSNCCHWGRHLCALGLPACPFNTRCDSEPT